tara:strand:+ start:838 stop:1434 length:597 start_codon:yes stop_codon:yes gene_type:complete
MKKILIVLICLMFPIISFADEVFIPVELWLGKNITMSEKIVFPEVNFKFGYKERHNIKGPIIWENSKTNENIKVYIRSRYSKKDDKEISQLWTVTNNNQCLGRVFDNRGNRFIENGCKFPIGFWKQGENRSFTSNYFDSKKGNYKRIKTITILNLEDNEKSCLKFNWKSSQNGTVIDDNIYEYCPRKGLIKVNGKEKF